MNLQINFDEFQLANGLNVILHVDQNVPVVAVNLWYRVGSRHEQRGKTGLAHLFEHMMFQGSVHISGEDFFRYIQSVGGALNGSTFFDRTNYFELLPSHYLEMGLWLEADRLGHLLEALNDDKLKNQIEVVKNERRQRVENQPYGLWFEKILELAFPDDFPYHWPTIGYMSDLDKTTLEDVREFFSTYYAPNNASLVIAGDFDPQPARQLIERYFASLPSGKTLPASKTDCCGFGQGEKRIIIEDQVQLPRLYFAYHIPRFGCDETYVVDVISDLLSEGKSARLYQSLVYQQQAAQEAQAFLLPMQEASLLIFMVTPKPEISLDDIEKRLQNEIDALGEGLVQPLELERVKNRIEARKVRELQSVSARADLLNMYAVFFNNAQMINDELARYERITLTDVQRTAQKYLIKDNRVAVSFIPVAR